MKKAVLTCVCLGSLIGAYKKMSRSSWFIGVGTLFTLSATLVASQMLLPITVNRSEGFVLATALVLSACYLWFGGLFKEPVLEYSAYLVHLTVPLVWLDCLATLHHKLRRMMFIQAKQHLIRPELLLMDGPGPTVFWLFKFGSTTPANLDQVYRFMVAPRHVYGYSNVW